MRKMQADCEVMPMGPEFTEREFEFSFNAEFYRRYSNVLVGIPSLPSLVQEGRCGYDVKFEFKEGYSLFLQHKISNFVTNPKGKYRYIYNYYGGPYYHFSLRRLITSNQHNLLHYMRQCGEETYYSAPLFFERNVHIQNAANETIMGNSVLFDPLEVGPIADFDLHKISYNQQGTSAAFHSEEKKMISIFKFEMLRGKLPKRKLDEVYFSDLLSVLKKGLTSVFYAKKIPEEDLKLPTIYQCIYLVEKFYRLQWFIF